MTKIWNVIKTKSFQIVAASLAIVLCVTGAVWKLATPANAEELTIGNANVQTFAGARVIENGTLVGTEDSNATMSVFITDGSAAKYNAENIMWTHDGIGWDSETDVLYEGESSQQKIFACAPYVADAADGVITVNASEQIDWLVATSKELTANDVNLTMTHALAKLVITPTLGGEVEHTGLAKIEVGGMYASGHLNVADNTWSNLSAANATLEMMNRELLVIPMASCTAFDVVFTMEDGRTFTTAVILATVDNQLEAGVQYNIKLQVGQDVVTIGEISAASWGSPVDSGVLETE